MKKPLMLLTIGLSIAAGTSCDKLRKQPGNDNHDSPGQSGDAKSDIFLGEWSGVAESLDQSTPQSQVQFTFRENSSFSLKYTQSTDASAEGTFFQVPEKDRIFLTIQKSTISKLGLKGDVSAFSYSLQGDILSLQSDKQSYFLRKLNKEPTSTTKDPGRTAPRSPLAGRWRCAESNTREWNLVVNDTTFSGSIRAPNAVPVRFQGAIDSATASDRALVLKIESASDKVVRDLTMLLQTIHDNRQGTLTVQGLPDEKTLTLTCTFVL